MRALLLLILMGLCIAVPAAAQQQANRVAFVIGNSAYQHAEVLPNPTADAELMERTLRAAGFDRIIVARDLGVSDFRQRLQAFQDLADNAEVALIYYAGHGIQVADQNRLLPIDADVTDPRNLPDIAINLDRLLDTLNNAQLRIVILDACRNNPFRGRLRSGDGTRAVGERGLAAIPSSRSGVLVMYAAAQGATASDGDSGANSPFAKALSEVLPQPGLPIHQLPYLVRDRTLELTNNVQEPYVSASISGRLFHLVPPQQSANVASASADEFVAFDDASRLAASGDCTAIRAHRARYTTGMTASAADIVIASCRQTVVAAVQSTTALPADFLSSLVASTREPLTRMDFAEVAAQLGCEPEALQAVAQVESGAAGAYTADGRPIILFEPHIFSRRTQRRFDASNPNVSYATWDSSRYPRTQGGRWNQLAEAYALDPENALASASWGRFGMIGFAHTSAGFPTPSAFVSNIVQSERRQLEAFAAFVRANNLADELVRKDWEGFARGYNGSGQVERYGRLMREAYERLRAQAG